MRVVLDNFFLSKVIQKPEDFKKVLTIPPVKSIIDLCNTIYGDEGLIKQLPGAWLSNSLFDEVYSFKCNIMYEVVKRFYDTGNLPTLTDDQKKGLIKREDKTIRFFPELPYEVWLEAVEGIEHSDNLPAEYRTQEMLIAIMDNGAKISPDLLTDALIDAYIDKHNTLDHIPNDRITLERLKKVLTNSPKEYGLDEDQMKGIIVDEELADLLTINDSNFKYIPDKYRTRERIVSIIANKAKNSSYRCYFYREHIPVFIKSKNWVGMKFNMEVIEKAGDLGVIALKSIYEELKIPLDMTGLVKAYPGAIKYVPKTEQNKTMADAVLASARAPKLKDFLSLKFITKTTSPLFLSSDNKDVVSKVERVLTGKPYKKEPPPYSIPSGEEMECDLTDEDITRLRNSNTPFII
jgi:hypothetical protein